MHALLDSKLDLNKAKQIYPKTASLTITMPKAWLKRLHSTQTITNMNSKRNKAKKRQGIQDHAIINIESRIYSLLLNFQFKEHFLSTPFPKNHAQTHVICTTALKMAIILQIYIMCIVNKGIASLIQKVLNPKNKNN